MNQILDETEDVLIPKKTFSKLAFGTAINTGILLFYYFTKITSDIKVSDISKPIFTPTFDIILSLSLLLGLVFSIISFVKKEPSSAIKWIAAIINIAPLLLVILVNIYDIFLR